MWGDGGGEGFGCVLYDVVWGICLDVGVEDFDFDVVVVFGGDYGVGEGVEVDYVFVGVVLGQQYVCGEWCFLVVYLVCGDVFFVICLCDLVEYLWVLLDVEGVDCGFDYFGVEVCCDVECLIQG